jgi:single-strand DNA-binding protein
MYETPIQLVGNLTADPECQLTTNGTVAVSFRVACTPRRYDRSAGEWSDGTTSFFSVKAWGTAAQNFVSSVVKGDRVIVLGSVATETWTPKDGGGDRSRQIVVADEMGPSTRFATARPEKAQRADEVAPVPEDEQL